MKYMRADEVKLGGHYKAVVSGRRVVVRLLRGDKFKGYEVLNLATGRTAKLASAARLHGEIGVEGNAIWQGSVVTA